MEGKHSPGRWTSFFKHKYQEWHVGIIPPEGMGLQLFKDGVPGETMEQKEANANLIAAAPDLLEALNQIANLCDGVSFSSHTQMKDAIEGSLEIAQIAINKAVKSDEK